MHELVRQQQSTDVEAVLEENAELRRRLEDLEKSPLPTPAADEDLLKKLDELDADNQILRQLLEEKRDRLGSNREGQNL